MFFKALSSFRRSTHWRPSRHVFRSRRRWFPLQLLDQSRITKHISSQERDDGTPCQSVIAENASMACPQTVSGTPLRSDPELDLCNSLNLELGIREQDRPEGLRGLTSPEGIQDSVRPVACLHTSSQDITGSSPQDGKQYSKQQRFFSNKARWPSATGAGTVWSLVLARCKNKEPAVSLKNLRRESRISPLQ